MICKQLRMRTQSRRRVSPWSKLSVATLLMAMILGTLTTVTAQWLPNWNRRFARVQRTELVAIAVDQWWPISRRQNLSRRTAKPTIPFSTARNCRSSLFDHSSDRSTPASTLFGNRKPQTGKVRSWSDRGHVSRRAQVQSINISSVIQWSCYARLTGSHFPTRARMAYGKPAGTMHRPSRQRYV